MWFLFDISTYSDFVFLIKSFLTLFSFSSNVGYANAKRSCASYNSLKSYHGTCDNIMSGSYIDLNSSGLKHAPAFIKSWKSVMKHLGKLLRIMKVGVKHVSVAKHLIRNYLRIYFNHKIVFPSDQKFKETILAALKPSLKKCLAKIKITGCKTSFAPCYRKESVSCEKYCHRLMDDKDCKEQEMVLKFGYIQARGQKFVNCKQSCRNL